MQNTSFLKIVLLYVTIMIGVLLWSGSDKEKSVYDRHRVSLKGAEVEVSDLQLTKKIFSELLEFEVKDESSDSKLIIIPDKKTIRISKNSDPHVTKVTFRIQVKNGIPAFRDHLIKRLSTLDFKNQNISISDITQDTKHNYFVFDSPSELRIIFYQRRFFSKQ